jgi:hypothetical protein
MPGNKPIPTYTESSFPVYATHHPGGTLGAQPLQPYLPPPPPFPYALKDLNLNLVAPAKPTLPDVLDDGWFEQKLQKLMDMKLELARTRLESQGPPVCPPLEAREEEEEKHSDPECFVKPVEDYAKPFCEFLTENPTVFHAVDYFKRKLIANGFTEVRCSLIFSSLLSVT